MPADRNHFILVASDQVPDFEPSLSALEVASHRLAKKYWPMSIRTPNRKHLQAGDQCLVYIAGTRSSSQTFCGSARIESIESWSEPDEFGIDSLAMGSIYETKLGLTKVCKFPYPVAIRPLLNRLEFHKGRKDWGRSLQGGCRKITRSDYEKISDKHL